MADSCCCSIKYNKYLYPLIYKYFIPDIANIIKIYTCVVGELIVGDYCEICESGICGMCEIQLECYDTDNTDYCCSRCLTCICDSCMIYSQSDKCVGDTHIRDDYRYDGDWNSCSYMDYDHIASDRFFDQILV